MSSLLQLFDFSKKTTNKKNVSLACFSNNAPSRDAIDNFIYI